MNVREIFGRMKYVGLVCAAGVLLGCWGPAGAATYYVDQGHAAANDANTGTDPAAPWKTLDKALATVGAGDTVYVKGSTNPASPDAIYDRSGKSGLGIATAGAPGNPITFAVWGGHTVILEGDMSEWGIDLTHASHHRIDGFVVRKFSKAAEGWRGAADVVIENCEFTQTAQTGLRLRDVTDFVMRDCYVHHCWEAGVSVRNGFNVTFERVESSYNDDGLGAAGDGDGFDSSGGDNHTYIDCVARGNSEDGFDLTANSTLNGCIAEGQTACNIKLWRRDYDNYAPKTMTIINSLSYDAGQAGIKASRGPAMNLYNCVVYNNAEEGVAFRGIEHSVGPASVTSNIVNCIIAANGWEGIEVLQSGPSTNTVLADHNLYYSNGSPNAGLAADTNAITGLDPLFTGPGVGDFHISPTSPARDNGTTICEVTTDFEGQIRPLGASYDIGADEYAPPAAVAGRHVFYNNCHFDG
ncbi:MAG: right-handed parallel beta-helix repeat-containing protein, partial [Phycisphaerae bacterium]|nr:right-handed parallel beta-helix repeat-containing protein [Phycisphaerae bacterium]